MELFLHCVLSWDGKPDVVVGLVISLLGFFGLQVDFSRGFQERERERDVRIFILVQAI